MVKLSFVRAGELRSPLPETRARRRQPVEFRLGHVVTDPKREAARSTTLRCASVCARWKRKDVVFPASGRSLLSILFGSCYGAVHGSQDNALTRRRVIGCASNGLENSAAAILFTSPQVGYGAIIWARLRKFSFCSMATTHK